MMLHRTTKNLALLLLSSMYMVACSGSHSTSTRSSLEKTPSVDACLEMLDEGSDERNLEGMKCLVWAKSLPPMQFAVAVEKLEGYLLSAEMGFRIRAFKTLSALQSPEGQTGLDVMLGRSDQCKPATESLMKLWRKTEGHLQRAIMYQIMRQECVPFAQWAWTQIGDPLVGFDADSAMNTWVKQHSDAQTPGRLVGIMLDQNQPEKKRSALATVISTMLLDLDDKKRLLGLFDDPGVPPEASLELGMVLLEGEPTFPLPTLLSIYSQAAVPGGVLERLDRVIVEQHLPGMENRPQELGPLLIGEGVTPKVRLAAILALGPLERAQSAKLLVPLLRDKQEAAEVRAAALEASLPHWTPELSKLCVTICDEEFESPVCTTALASLEKKDPKTHRKLQETVIIERRATQFEKRLEDCKDLGACFEVYTEMRKPVFQRMSLAHRKFANAMLGLATVNLVFVQNVGAENLALYNAAMKSMGEAVSRALDAFNSGYYGGGVIDTSREEAITDAVGSQIRATLDEHGDVLNTSFLMIFVNKCGMEEGGLRSKLDLLMSPEENLSFFVIRVNYHELEKELGCVLETDPEYIDVFNDVKSK